MTRNRVLWLIKGLGLGGAERLLVTMAGRMDPHYEIEVAHLLPSRDGFTAEFEAMGIPVTCLDARWTAEPAWPYRLRRLLHQRDYALIHTHSPVPAVAARLLAPRAARLVHTEHNLWTGYRLATRVANAATFGRNTAAFAVSDAVRRSMGWPAWVRSTRFPRVETLRYGVEVARFSRGPAARRLARERLGIDDARPLVGTVASFTPQKDHAGLVAAFERVSERVPDVLLLLVGTGPLERDVRELIERRGLGDRIRFLGARRDVADLLPGLDVFVLGSRFEGLPISLLEAMASGVACVATDVGGIPEALRDGREGTIVPPGRSDQLADAVAELLLDDGRRARLADAAYRRVDAEFSIDRAVRRTDRLYREILAT